MQLKKEVKLTADEVETACQSACPTEAIVFGDSNNDNSTVSQNIENMT